MTEATREIGFEQAQALEERYLMRTYKRGPVDFVRGEGPLLWDAEGKRYLDFLTDVEGWLADPEDEGSLITRATVEEVDEKLPSLAGGMRPKLQACADAIRGGAQSAHIIDGRIAHSLLLELFTDAGIGTMVTP